MLIVFVEIRPYPVAAVAYMPTKSIVFTAAN
jgi:hypothetical protein